jgi:hypothetical protein
VLIGKDAETVGLDFQTAARCIDRYRKLPSRLDRLFDVGFPLRLTLVLGAPSQYLSITSNNPAYSAYNRAYMGNRARILVEYVASCNR